ncbi:MAG TPA: ParB/RepB/Spo0J family partition protein [Tepidisphaeraceae bacterium]|jgi:ParB family chromosome partitioning protein|nr:ParB/RepB/Spo0J family partition protein [Tepidisphaeraceae bacterium]
MSLKPKPRLGRGLSSLISLSNASPDVPLQASEARPKSQSPDHANSLSGIVNQPEYPEAAERPHFAMGVNSIPLEFIAPNPHQPRRAMNETTIAELAASLKSTGLIQPIVVRKMGEQYQLIAGERRWRAAKLAGFATIPAFVRDATSLEQAQMALVENIQREDLNPIDRAQAYKTLMTQLGLTQAELAGRTGEDRSSVANYLRLLDLIEAVRVMVADGRLSMGHAKILASVRDPVEQEKLANLVVGQNLSVRNLERQLEQGGNGISAVRVTPDPSAHVLDLEKSLTQQLGLRVQVRAAAKKGKGRVILHYGTLDQFDELMTRLGAKVDS